MSIIDAILDAVVSGFGIYCIVLFCLSTFNVLNIDPNRDLFNDTAIQVVIFAGIIILFSWIIYIYDLLIPDRTEEQRLLINNRMFGPYWFGFWLRPVVYFLGTQLLWIKNIRRSKWSKLFIGIILLFAWNIERFIIIITSMHRDFLPTSWTIYNSPYSLLFKFLYDFAVFLAITGVVYFIRMKVRLIFKNN